MSELQGEDSGCGVGCTGTLVRHSRRASFIWIGRGELGRSDTLWLFLKFLHKQNQIGQSRNHSQVDRQYHRPIAIRRNLQWGTVPWSWSTDGRGGQETDRFDAGEVFSYRQYPDIDHQVMFSDFFHLDHSTREAIFSSVKVLSLAATKRPQWCRCLRRRTLIPTIRQVSDRSPTYTLSQKCLKDCACRETALTSKAPRISTDFSQPTGVRWGLCECCASILNSEHSFLNILLELLENNYCSSSHGSHARLSSPVPSYYSLPFLCWAIGSRKFSQVQ